MSFRIYICRDCSWQGYTPCSLIVDGDANIPAVCPYERQIREAKWVPVVDDRGAA